MLNVGTDAGYPIARTLPQADYRVAVVCRHATRLSRIIDGYRLSHVIVIAADNAKGEHSVVPDTNRNRRLAS